MAGKSRLFYAVKRNDSHTHRHLGQEPQAPEFNLSFLRLAARLSDGMKSLRGKSEVGVFAAIEQEARGKVLEQQRQAAEQQQLRNQSRSSSLLHGQQTASSVSTGPSLKPKSKSKSNSAISIAKRSPSLNKSSPSSSRNVSGSTAASAPILPYGPPPHHASSFVPTAADLDTEDGEVWQAAPNAPAQRQAKLGLGSEAADSAKPSKPPPAQMEQCCVC